MENENKHFGKAQLIDEITVLPPDDPKHLKLGWTIYEQVATTNNIFDYSGKSSQTDEADKYRGHYGHSVFEEHNNHTLFTTHEILSELNGRPWDNLALSAVLMFEPSNIRVVEHNGSITLDCMPKRITVWLQEDNRTIKKIDMALSPRGIGVKTGEDFEYKMKQIPLPSASDDPLCHINPEAITRINFNS